MAVNITPAVAGADILADDVNQRNKRELFIEASENLLSGDLLRIIDDAGTPKVEKIFQSGGGGDTITIPGVRAQHPIVAASGISFLASAKIATDKVIFAWKEAASPFNGKAIVATATGDVITYGTEFTFNAADTSSVTLIRVQDDKVVVAYTDDGDAGQGRAKVLSITGTTISAGTEATFDSNDTNGLVGSLVDTDKFFLAYRDNTSTLGQGIVGTVSGTTLSFGSEVTFQASSVFMSQNTCATLDTLKAVFTYSDAGDSFIQKAMIVTVSGTVPTFGVKQAINGNNIGQLSTSKIDTNKGIISYEDSSTGKSTAFTVSGTVMTFGTEVTFNAGATDRTDMVQSSTDKAILNYSDASATNDGKAVILSISGTTITVETPITYDTGSTGEISITELDTNKFISGYEETVDLYGIVLDVTGGGTLNAGDFVAIATDAIAIGVEGFVTMPVGYNTSFTGMTFNAIQYISNSGTRTEVDAGNGTIGRALDDTTLLVFPDNIT